MELDAVVAGHICLDIIPELHGPLPDRPGVLVETGPATLSMGGAVGNTGLALHLIGLSTALMGKIGDDALGRTLRGVIDSYGAHLSRHMIVSSDDSSSYTVVLSPPDTDRSFLHNPGPNDTFDSTDIPYEVVAQARLFHFGYPVLMRRFYESDTDQLPRMFRQVKESGLTTSLDTGCPDTSAVGHIDWVEILKNTLPYVDIFLPSEDELRYMLNRSAFDAGTPITNEEIVRLAEESIRMGAKIVGIKCGERGLYIRTASARRFEDFGRCLPADLGPWANRELWSVCFEPSVFAGTTGTGDATIAGFLAALLYGCSLGDAATFACAVGASCVEAPNATGGIQSWESTWKRLTRGWNRNGYPLDEDGWSHDIATGLWTGPRDDCSSS